MPTFDLDQFNILPPDNGENNANGQHPQKSLMVIGVGGCLIPTFSGPWKT